VLRRLEAVSFFLVMMPAVVRERALVCFLSEQPLVQAGSHRYSSVTDEWPGLTLPRGWWRWTIALGAMQRFSLLLERVAAP
jgi:hypothetical protein